MCTIRVFSRLSVTPSFPRLFVAWARAELASARGRQVTTQSSAHRVSWYPLCLISLSKGVSRILLSSGDSTPQTQKVTSALIAGLHSIVLVVCLICASKGNIHMTDVAIDRCAEGGTSQCGPQVARARAERGGSCLVVVAPVRNVAPSGLPIHRRGPVDRPTGAGCRGGDGSDVQAAARPGGRGPGAGGGRRNDDQRHGQPSAAGVSRRSRQQWLNGAAMIAVSNSSTRLTVSSPSSWSRSTGSWFQNGFVPLASIRA